MAAPARRRPDRDAVPDLELVHIARADRDHVAGHLVTADERKRVVLAAGVGALLPGADGGGAQPDEDLAGTGVGQIDRSQFDRARRGHRRDGHARGEGVSHRSRGSPASAGARRARRQAGSRRPSRPSCARVATDAEAMCGTTNAFSSVSSGSSTGIGSGSVTSRPAAMIQPSDRARYRAFWSTTGPRDVLMSTAEGFIEPEPLLVDEVARLVGEVRVQRHEVGPREDARRATRARRRSPRRPPAGGSMTS